MSLPPRRRLARVLRALARELPAQCAGLLEHPRFADGRAALARFGSDAARDEAVAAMTSDEAGWLADELADRWGWIGSVALGPEAALLHPDEIWIGDAPVKLPLELVVADVDAGWEAAWDGAAPEPGAARAVATIRPPSSAGPAAHLVRVHVRGHAAGARVALIAVARIAVRRPAIAISDDRRRLIVSDQAGRPATGARVSVGERTFIAGPGGLIELDAPAASGLVLRVEDVAAGRIAHPDVSH